MIVDRRRGSADENFHLVSLWWHDIRHGRMVLVAYSDNFHRESISCPQWCWLPILMQAQLQLLSYSFSIGLTSTFSFHLRGCRSPSIPPILQLLRTNDFDRELMYDKVTNLISFVLHAPQEPKNDENIFNPLWAACNFYNIVFTGMLLVYSHFVNASRVYVSSSSSFCSIARIERERDTNKKGEIRHMNYNPCRCSSVLLEGPCCLVEKRKRKKEDCVNIPSTSK